MQLMRRRSKKVGLFLAALIVLLAGSDIFAPLASASGEYYQYIPSDNTVRVTGGIVSTPAGLQCNAAGDACSGEILVAGFASRVPNGNNLSSSAPCPYTLQITINGDPKVKGDVPPDFAHSGTAGFTYDGAIARSPGDCMRGDFIGSSLRFSGDQRIMLDFLTTSIIVHPGTDPAAAACPGSNAPAGTDCKSIPPGCAGSTSTTPAPVPPPDPATCPFQATSLDPAAEPDVCPIEKGTALRWIACPIVAGGEAITNGLDATINYFLTIDTTKVFGSATGAVGSSTNPTGAPNDPAADNGFYKAWSTFRNFGIGLVVIAGLIMVMSEALGLQIVDAYTVRKVLPRLLVAVIGITLSWSLMFFLITFFNRIGTGMASIIYSSFGGTTANKSGATSIFAQYFIAGGGLLALGFLGVLSFLGTLILALLVGIAVLILREGIVLMCVIVAPLAIASYVLPNTSKFASFWWDTFIKALMAFPIITGFIAICKVMAAISQNI